MQESAGASEQLTIPVRVGTMGWSYADWNGPFYPEAGPGREAIRLYSRVLDVVEIDSTFYGTPRETTVRNWRDSTPPGFLFCPKIPRLITHDAGLRDVAAPLEEFTATMALLGPKRGPMLIQLPPSFTRDSLSDLKTFMPLLAQVSDRTARFAIEFRHRSLVGPDVSELLSEHNVALVAADYPAMPKRMEATADFTYVRLVGRHGAYEQHRESQADRSAEIAAWADALRSNQSRFSVAYVFCNNDYEGFSPATVNKVKHFLDLKESLKPPESQGSLF